MTTPTAPADATNSDLSLPASARPNQRVTTQIVRRLSELGLENDELAKHLGISEATLVRRLTSQTSFTVAEVANAATILQCTLADLIPIENPSVRQSA